MVEEFNLIATCAKFREFEAIDEIERLLSELGDREARAWESEVRGLVLVSTKLNPYEAIEKLRELAREKPWEFSVVKRVIPVEVNVKTDLEEISEACKKLSRRISRDETFRVTVEKRHSGLSSREIIEAAAKHVDSPVDLKNPKKIILIEVVGRVTGISLIEGDKGILNVQKELAEA